MPNPIVPRPAAAGVVGCLAFVLIGWTGLLIPSLIRSIEPAFDQTDAGIGVLYFVYALAYASGSLVGGLATERIGRRAVLSFAAFLHGAGFIVFGTAATWPLFLAAAMPAALGAGAIDGGGNGLILDLYRSRRGRALNLLHLFFSVGALSAPLVVGRLVDAGVPWGSILVATGVAAIIVGILFALVPMPDGRHSRAADDAAANPVPVRLRDRFAAPLILLAVAIACYVASEVGVSNWLVRFLEPASLTDATTALSLFWAGLTVGRLVSARIADRFDHIAFTATAAVILSIALTGAILAPSLPLSIALFAVTGFASGPVFPMIIAIGGDRYPERSAAVSGFLSSTAVVGAIVYPPVMGFLSVTVGLTVAMLGNVVLGLACAVTLLAVARIRPQQAR